MTFDLMTYADRHRYRTRNLHDGRPLHPLRVPVRHRGRSSGYAGDDDRMDAIICRHGYVCIESNRRIGWYLFAGSAKGINRWLPKLEALGAVVEQEGDQEAAGHASVEQIDAILEVLKPYRLGNLHRVGMRVGPRIDATAPGPVGQPHQRRRLFREQDGRRQRRILCVASSASTGQAQPYCWHNQPSR